jgi:hypothetical protein
VPFDPGKEIDMSEAITETAPFTRNFVRDVRFRADRCEGPAFVMLIATGDIVTGVCEPISFPATDAGPFTETLADMTRLIAGHAELFGPDVAGYAIVSPGERVAFAVDRDRITHQIELSGTPTEPLRADRWGGVCDGLTAMINAATR